MAPHDHEGIEPNEYFAQVEAQQQRALMAQEDFSNRWDDMVLRLSTDDLETIRQMLGGLSMHGPKPCYGLANYMEGHVAGVLKARNRLDEKTDPSRHAFIPDAEDLDNPYCTAVDNQGIPCNLGPSHKRHQ